MKAITRKEYLHLGVNNHGAFQETTQLFVNDHDDRHPDVCGDGLK